MRVRASRPVLLTAALLGLLGGPATASGSAASPTIGFQPPVKLTGATGGEPSIATDGAGNVYVSGPQGIPSGANGTPGVALWISRNHAGAFGAPNLLGSFLGGGDSDIQVSPDGNVVGLLDLEAVASAVCFSKDKGASFTGASPAAGACQGVTLGQAGPSADREWLTLDNGGRAYVTYHEFFTAQPLIFRTDNLGQDAFTAGPCGPIISASSIVGIEPNVPEDITSGTLMSKPVLDKQGNIYILFTTPTLAENAAARAQVPPKLGGTFSQQYLAVSKDHCQSFTDYTIFDGAAIGTNTVQFGDIFNDLAIDGAGNLYSIAAGYIGTKPPTSTTADIFLFTSTDHGVTWKGPRKITQDVGAHMLPAAVGGPAAGQLAIAYFRTTNGKTDPNDTAGLWTYTAAESTNALDPASANFTFQDVNPGFIYHKGDVCTSGILCGTGAPGTGSDRSLLDFTAGTIDSDGCPIFTWAGNPAGSPGQNPGSITFNYVSKQTTGCFALPATASQSQPSPLPSLLPNTAAAIVGRASGLAPAALLGAVLLLLGSAAMVALQLDRRRRAPRP
jgi:hypothetical protein